MIWRNKSILIFVACAIGGTIAVYLVVLRHEDVTIVDTWFLYIETIKKLHITRLDKEFIIPITAINVD